MTKSIKIYTALVLVFLVMLGFSGSVPSEIWSNIVYIMAFVLPVAVALYCHKTLKREREEEKGIAEKEKWFFKIKTKEILPFSFLIIPSIALVMLVSFLTNLILTSMGVSNSAVEIQSLGVMLVVHALIPTVLEEALFRYVPLKILSPYSKKSAILLSATYFALIHCNLFQIPYAFLAGLIFISIDILFDSVLPSLIIHFLNNTFSVLLIKYGEVSGFATVYYSVIGALLLVSVVGIVFYFKKYREKTREVFLDDKYANATLYPFAVAIPTVALAISNLFLE